MSWGRLLCALGFVALCAGCGRREAEPTPLPFGIVVNLGPVPTIVPPPVQQDGGIRVLVWDSLTVVSGGTVLRIVRMPMPSDSFLFRRYPR